MGAADYPIVTDETLPSIIEGEVTRSIGYMDGTFSAARTRQFDYYYGKPFGNEVDGESTVVSTDVADTVEGILPIILNIFTASDDVVRFDPNGPEDEEQAAQQTEVANYVFYRQNNGFLVLYQWFKDALIQNNGIVKYWWDNKTTRAKESYQGLTEGEYRMLKEDEKAISIEEQEIKSYDDPAALQARQIMMQQIQQQVPPEMQQQALALMNQQPIPQLYDCTLMITRDVSQIRIEAIPPEEFGISSAHNCVSIQDTPFCYHRTKKSLSNLREMGVPEDIIVQLAPANEPDITPEAWARDRYIDETWRESGGPAQIERDVWVTECFIRVDYDGDGISELRHIIMPGRTVWINEETDHINFAALTPIIMPHRWIGRSVAELVMDLQFQKSVLWRQMFNNLYLTNNPQKAVLSSSGGIVQANLDDLMTSRPGGILREYVAGAIRHVETPFVAGASFPMLEYLDGVKENRTGVTRYNQGTDSDSLNKTARGISLIQNAGQQRTNLIARIFAETGVKDLMRGIVYMLSKYSQKSMTLKLRNKWVDIDPRSWKTQFNMTVNVGLGTGNKDAQIQHLAMMHQQQIELMKEGRGYMVSDENVWNLYKKQSEALGFKHPELFVSDPTQIDPKTKQKAPDPAAMKVQADAQIDAAKLQQTEKKTQIDAQKDLTVAQIQASAQEAVAKIKAAADVQIEQMRIQANAQLAVFDKRNNLEGEARQLDAKASELGKDAELLRLKKQVDDFVLAQKQKEVDGAENKVVGPINAGLEALMSQSQQLTQQMAQATQVLSAVGQTVSAQAKESASAKAERKKPRNIRLGNVQTDADGKVIGADVVMQ